MLLQFLYESGLIHKDKPIVRHIGADLSRAKAITNEQLLEQAKSLEGTTMPNGQKYEDWLKAREPPEG